MSEKNPVALGEYVLVELFDPEDQKTKSGIILPGSVANGDKPSLEVRSVGPGVDIGVQIGDRIELSEGIRINYFLSPQQKRLGVIHQKYIAAAWKEEK